MSTATAPTGRTVPARRHLPVGRLVRVAVLLVVDVLVGLALPDLFGGGAWYFGAAVVVVLVGLNVVLLVDRLVPWRWLAPGLAFLVLLTIAPVVYTLYVAFTNYSSSHLLSRSQAVTALQVDTYLPDGAPTYSWKAFRAADGTTALWLAPAGDQPARLATSDGQIRTATPGSDGVGALTDGGPASIPGYTRLSLAQTVQSLRTLQDQTFGPPGNVIRIASLSSAANFQQRYTYDSATDTVTDRQTSKTYQPVQGTFTATDGSTISPSFRTTVGFDNFRDLFGNSAIRSVALQILVWTVVFAVGVVAVQFVIGLAVSLALNDEVVPRWLAKLLRSVMLLPYVIPAFLGILVWGAMLNPNIGIITTTLSRVLGLGPNWVGDPTGAKVAVSIIAFWIGFPYFVLVVSGGLQAIPGDVLEAAEVDGAGSVQKFRQVVLPLLLKTVGPLIVLGMAFNFNNFMIAYLYNSGGPPFAGVDIPAGHTDLLIGFVYKLAFAFGNGSNYGLAAVITMFIFVLLVPIVASQFRHYAVWQEED